MSNRVIHIIGAGLAGSEAAWQVSNSSSADNEIKVILHEMRPKVSTEAHQTDKCAELVCSNSFRSDDAQHNAVGLLHSEMRKMNSLIMQCADECKVPAGSALAVDREKFSEMVTSKLKSQPNITIEYGEVTDIPPEDWEDVIIATGPLTAPALTNTIKKLSEEDNLHFFDAIAPIVLKETIDMSKAWFQSRYDKGDGKDYINCPMNKEEYEVFIQALIDGQYTEFKEWEKDTPYFEGCLPIEVMAGRGVETLRYGPMKPKGLTNPHDPDVKSHAIVQLRQDNSLGTLFNMVGFQTKLTYGEQKRIFKTIPGLENAEFIRLGGIHRNIFINSPKILDDRLRLKAMPRLRFAGQITGCEGYIESAAIGLIAGRFSAANILTKNITAPPVTTALGALLNHITTGANAETFQPMNVNFGLFPPVEFTGKRPKGRDKKKAYTEIAVKDFDDWLKNKGLTK